MKIFFNILALFLFLLKSGPCLASFTPVGEEQTQQVDYTKRSKEIAELYKQIPSMDDKEAFQRYLRERLEIVSEAAFTPEELATSKSVSLVSDEDIRKQQEETLSSYEKIYRDSLKKATDNDKSLNEGLNLEGQFYQLERVKEQATPYIPDFPYVTVKLSDAREIIAPAEEHIPYILTTLEINPTGLLNVSEEITFISNNEGFPQGFFRILPKYTYSRHKQKRRLDITLDSVKINNEEVPYKITEVGNHLYIEPTKPLSLPTGIYTYQFNYTIDRLIWNEKGFDEFYWDITAKTLKNVVGSANALITLPKGKTFLAQNAIVSTKRGLDPQRVTINTLADNALGFADTEALAVGEDVHVYITLEKGTLLPPTLMQKYLWFIYDYGAMFFALLTLLAIYIAYKISSHQIRRNKDKYSVSVRKTPSFFRAINLNVIDKVSFGAEILNLCAKKVVELKEKNDEAILFKKTDNLKSLTKDERSLINALFPGTETILTASPESKLKLKRAYSKSHLTTLKQLNWFKLKLNSGYLGFSLGMLLVGEIGSAALAVNPWHTFLIIIIASVILFITFAMFLIKLKNKILTYLLRVLLIIVVLVTTGILSIYTSFIYSFIIMDSLGVIIYYYKKFSLRNGLLKNKIKETEDLKSYLSKNAEMTIKARDFSAKLPYIFAFNLEYIYKDVKDLDLIKKFLIHIS